MRVFESYADLRAAMDIPLRAPGSFRFFESYMPAGFRCSQCGKVHPFQLNGATGYAVKHDSEEMLCYPCAAENERVDMIKNGRWTLYLTEKDGRHYVGNWTADNQYRVTCYSVGRHNIAGKRYDVRFIGPDGAEWSGVTYGDNTQICHVRRLKLQPAKAA
jgi:hypothetical protein